MWREWKKRAEVKRLNSFERFVCERERELCTWFSPLLYIYYSVTIHSTLYIPPWLLNGPGILLSLNTLWNKFEVSAAVFHSKFNEIVYQYDSFARISTHGSKIGEAVGAAAIVASQVRDELLLNNLSILSAEVQGLLLALNMVYSGQSLKGKLMSFWL